MKTPTEDARATALTNAVNEQALAGSWVGGFMVQERWIYLQAHFVVVENAVKATFDLLFDAGMGLAPTTLQFNPPQLDFELMRGGERATFAGQLLENELRGKMRQGAIQSQFRLVKVAHPPFEFPTELLGTYELAPQHFVFIGNLFGGPIPAWHDFKTGTIRVLFAAQPDSYFTGPSLLVPFPNETELHFQRDEQNQVVGLRWRQGDDAQNFALRVKLVAEEVSFDNGDVTLAGTLLRPPTPGPHPAVVLVHGSGPQIRAWVQLYAETFARHGIAALMYDKRGSGRSTGNWESAYGDLADDALAALHLLRSHPAIDPDKIGLCGGSQAGWVMPIAAARSPQVAFLIILAGPAVSITQQNLHGIVYSMRAEGYAEEEVQAAAAHYHLFHQVLCTGEGWEEFQQSLRHGKQTAWANYAWSLDQPPSPADLAGIRAEMERDPLPTLEQVTCPVLALFGESDTVVPVAENKSLLEKAFQHGKNPDYTIQVLPKATHTFLESPTGADKEFPLIRKWVTQHIDITLAWLSERMARG